MTISILLTSLLLHSKIYYKVEEFFLKIFIKKAVKEDIKEINKMLTDLIQDERQYDENINENYIVENYYEQFLDKKDACIIVAKNKNNDIIGYGFGLIMNYGNVYYNKVAQLDAVFIKPEYRNNGIAKNIIQYFTKWAKDNEVLYIELKVCNNNKNAINLYESQDFHTEKLILKRKL